MREQSEGGLSGGNSHSSGVIWSWFSFLWPPPEWAFALPYYPPSPNTKNGEGKELNPISTRHSTVRMSFLWQAQIHQMRNCLLSSREEASHSRQQAVTKFKRPLYRIGLVSQHGRSTSPCFIHQTHLSSFPGAAQEGDTLKGQCSQAVPTLATSLLRLLAQQ